MAEEMDHDGDSYMRQRLLYAEEVYLYKIPPMKDANGHRSVVSIFVDHVLLVANSKLAASCSSLLVHGMLTLV
jgi:hypothetical protein